MGLPNIYQGNHLDQWTKDRQLKNFYTACVKCHWQYMSIDPVSSLHEFSRGPARELHAGGYPGQPDSQKFLRLKGGILSINVPKKGGTPTIAVRHRMGGSLTPS